MRPGGLVRFVEDSQVKRLVRLHTLGDNVCRLIGGKDELHAAKRRGRKFAHAPTVGGNREIQVFRTQDDLINLRLYRWIGADAETGDQWPSRLTHPFM
jgi:hypothetical protein